MFDQQDGAVRPQAAQKLDHSLRFLGAHACEWLVEKEHARLGREAHGDFERAAFAVRECDGRRVVPLTQADDFERARRRLGARTAAYRRLVERPGAREPGLRGEPAILERAEFEKDIASLKRASDAEPGHVLGPCGAQRLAANQNRAGARPQLAGKQIDQRRFARAVGTDKRVNFGALELERHAVDRDEAPEAARQLACRQHGFSHFAFSRANGATSDRHRSVRSEAARPLRSRNHPSAAASAS